MRWHARIGIVGLAVLGIGCGSTASSGAGGRDRFGVSQPGSKGARPSDSSDEGLLDFSLLSGFEYRAPEPPQSLAASDVESAPPPPDSVPAAVRALDGDHVRLRGFVVPLDLENGRITSFLLLPDHRLCCAGQEPRINDMVEVSCESPVRFVRDERVEVAGRLEVGEVFEYGYLASLFRLKADDYAVIGGGPSPPPRR